MPFHSIKSSSIHTLNYTFTYTDTNACYFHTGTCGAAGALHAGPKSGLGPEIEMSPGLQGGFDFVFLDEASQATEAESLTPCCLVRSNLSLATDTDTDKGDYHNYSQNQNQNQNQALTPSHRACLRHINSQTQLQPQVQTLNQLQTQTQTQKSKRKRKQGFVILAGDPCQLGPSLRSPLARYVLTCCLIFLCLSGSFPKNLTAYTYIYFDNILTLPRNNQHT